MVLKITEAERSAIDKVCELAEVHGYGNLISHLQAAWMNKLITENGMREEDARFVACGTHKQNATYPVKMHLALRQHGEYLI